MSNKAAYTNIKNLEGRIERMMSEIQVPAVPGDDSDRTLFKNLLIEQLVLEKLEKCSETTRKDLDNVMRDLLQTLNRDRLDISMTSYVINKVGQIVSSQLDFKNRVIYKMLTDNNITTKELLESFKSKTLE